MNGGTINQLTKEPDGIVLRIHGIGPLRHQVMMVRILPTNYHFQIGDLVWWDGDRLHWEGNVSCLFHRTLLDNGPVNDIEPVDKTFWHKPM